ncbi:TIGR02391 family protein [Streptomyces prunicolor]|uniref:TIGR02391 family protein n=1 Tax=Streptomyces prunicolor TaxID=67348 RepID=UPI003714FD52
MHPTIRGAARKLWLDGHFRLAVQSFRPAVPSAAETLTSQLKTRTGLADMDATNVYEKVFNARSPVLTWPGDPSDHTVSSMQNQFYAERLSKYAPGLDMTVRNTATHVASDEMTAQQALERLAALSLLAHWIDECEGPILTSVAPESNASTPTREKATWGCCCHRRCRSPASFVRRAREHGSFETCRAATTGRAGKSHRQCS